MEYFLNEMQPFEVEAILENANYIDSNLWDMTRLNMYGNLSMWSKKKLKVTDIITFPWDNDNTSSGADTSISNEDIERLREKAKNYGSI